MPRPVFPFASRASRALLVASFVALTACAQFKVTAPPAETQPAPVAAAPVETLAPAPEPVAPEPVVPEMVRIGLMVPLTGSAARVGQDLLDAAQMALFDFRPGQFELRVYDSGSNPVIAGAAAARAQQDGVQFLLGPLFSGAVGAVADVLRPAGIPVYAFSSDRLVGGDGVYVGGFVPEAQVARTVGFAARRGMFRFASLVPNDAYGSRMNTSFGDAVLDAGGEIVAGSFYPYDTEGMTEAVRTLARYDERAEELKLERERLAEKNDAIFQRAIERLETLDTLGEVGFEALLLLDGGEQILQLSPLLAFFDIDPVQVKLLGTWIWDDPALGKEPSMLGAWYAAPPRASRLRFVERFAQTYGRDPDRLATLAYDGVALAAVLALSKGPAGMPYAMENLENPEGFAGVDGIFRLHPSGEVERGLAVLEIGRDGPREIDPAPTNFRELPTN